MTSTLAIHLVWSRNQSDSRIKNNTEDNPSSQSIDGYGERLKKTWLGALSGSVSTKLVVEAIKTFGGFRKRVYVI